MQHDDRPDLLSMTPSELRQYCQSTGLPVFRAKQIFSWLHRGCQYEEMTDLPHALRVRLQTEAPLRFPTIAQKLISATDGTVKYIFRLHDGEIIESVVMQYHHGTTICISSQVGCRMGCRFCASTLHGKVRDLAPSELLGQILIAAKDLQKRIDGVVLMGIGEPLDNYENVLRFLHLVSDPAGVCIGLLGLMSDFGTAAIFFVTFLVIAYLRSGDAATLALICGGAAFGAGIIVQFKPYILSRFAAWGHAWEAASGSGYQQTRTMSAAASGGLFGMGAGNGWLERIPAGDTDLVFGMLCEEWGLVIALLAVACILTLAWFAVRASRTGRSSFYTIAACAAGSLLVFQTSLNVFGSVDLLPLTGVTFPFVSNGGSAMLSAWGLLAYLKAMDTRADASFAIGRAAERKLDEEAARMAAPAEDAFEKEDGHAED